MGMTYEENNCPISTREIQLWTGTHCERPPGIQSEYEHNQENVTENRRNRQCSPERRARSNPFGNFRRRRQDS